ncbi:ArnT family glycosyltransferase [Varunaivibrio sulfuroxidans]|nr:glycosyltransferase family 39 protein [Varunaivibrio sulfuroxidans]WES30289.1 glycosyltransferase family 39 protein [Varunaivibrio sulfuroxidans]
MTAGIMLRPYLPIDETRYITVAWEMWRDHSFLVPHLNGELYSQKPPLLFWMIHLGWAIFGVNDVTPRLVAPLFGLANLFMTYRIARQLWPSDADALIARIAPPMVLTGFYWAVFSSMTMFDMLVTFFTLMGISALLGAWRAGGGRGHWPAFITLGLAMGFGALAKGPVILLHLLPIALLAPYWGRVLSFAPEIAPRRDKAFWKKWYLSILIAVAIGFAVALSWAIPAAVVGGPAYADAIFWRQSAGRMVKSFAHRRPYYWYLLLLPVLLLPWTVWPRLWAAVGGWTSWRAKVGLRAAWRDGGGRFLLLWIVPVFIAFSLISGKQPHYLLPEFPAIMVLFAFLLVRHQDRAQAQEQTKKAIDWTIRPPALFIAALSAILIIAIYGALLLARFDLGGIPPWLHLVEGYWLVFPLAGGALLAWRGRGRRVGAQVAALSSLAMTQIVFLHLALAPALHAAYDLKPISLKLKAWEDAGRPFAQVGNYHGQYQFLGRLKTPMGEFRTLDEATQWLGEHPNGVLITYPNEKTADSARALYFQDYRGQYLAVWDSAHRPPAQ